MVNTDDLITQVYSAFNRRDIDGVFAWMNETVDWPRASESGRAVGKEEIRAYWTRQWSEIDPRVDPVEITEVAGNERDAGKLRVKVHQVVRDLKGTVLFDGVVFHVYTLANGLIDRMDIRES